MLLIILLTISAVSCLPIQKIFCHPEDEYACKNGTCIPIEWMCDNVPDCLNGEDEIKCPFLYICAKNYFACPSGECLQKDVKCDGHLDCSDGSDEHGCHHSSHAGHQMKIIESGFGLFVSFLLIFALGAIYEGLKWFRIYLQMKETKRIRKQRRVLSPPVTMNQLEESVNKRLGTPHQPNEALLSPSGLNGDQVYVSTVKEADDVEATDTVPPGLNGEQVNVSTVKEADDVEATDTVPPGLNGEQVNISTVKEADDVEATDVGFLEKSTTKSKKKKAYEGFVTVTEDNAAVSQRQKLIPFLMIGDAALQILQLILGYSLMLVFMTLNIWLCAAVVFGEAIAYLVFWFLYPDLERIRSFGNQSEETCCI